MEANRGHSTTDVFWPGKKNFLLFVMPVLRCFKPIEIRG